MPRLPRRILNYGPAALLLVWQTKIDPDINRSVHGYAAVLRRHPAVRECVPAYASLLIGFVPGEVSVYRLREFIYAIELPETQTVGGIRHELPVCYDDRLAYDLKAVVGELGTNKKTLIKRHTAPEYRVYQLGFRPGFGFLGQTDERLEIARHASPRPRVPAGAVGLAGRQTGIYPSESPGGWQLIGRCPVPMVRAGEEISRLQPGDTVRFYAIDYAAFTRFNPATTPWPTR